ncbi:MAG: helix-turn-helix domain-containing protein [Muribaculaceae bacterium]
MTNIESYNLGRLIAVIEVCVDTPADFVGMAIQNPLQKLVPLFIQAAKQESANNESEYNHLITAIVNNIPPTFPARLSPTEATQAWMGYHKQRTRIADPKIIRTEIGTKIRNAREAAALSQQQLADLAGIDRTNVAKIETGRYNVTLETLSRICTAMGLNLDLIAPEA